MSPHHGSEDWDMRKFPGKCGFLSQPDRVSTKGYPSEIAPLRQVNRLINWDIILDARRESHLCIAIIFLTDYYIFIITTPYILSRCCRQNFPQNLEIKQEILS
jgi:hypothetical protein